jgi:hypothetical protein
VQASHAAHESGKISGNYENICSLVLCEAQSEEELIEQAEYLKIKGIPFTLFREPDIANQATALATLPLSSAQRKKLTRWKLWEA